MNGNCDWCGRYATDLYWASVPCIDKNGQIQDESINVCCLKCKNEYLTAHSDQITKVERTQAEKKLKSHKAAIAHFTAFAINIFFTCEAVYYEYAMRIQLYLFTFTFLFIVSSVCSEKLKKDNFSFDIKKIFLWRHFITYSFLGYFILMLLMN